MNRFELEAVKAEKARIEKVRLIVKARQLQQQQAKKTRIEKVRLVAEARQLQQQQTKKTRIEKTRLIEKARITKKKTEAFVCRRCLEKYFSNIKLHEHIRTKHTKFEKRISNELFSFLIFITTSKKPIS